MEHRTLQPSKHSGNCNSHISCRAGVGMCMQGRRTEVGMDSSFRKQSNISCLNLPLKEGASQLTVQLSACVSLAGDRAETRGPGNTMRHETWVPVLALLLPGLEKPLNHPNSSFLIHKLGMIKPSLLLHKLVWVNEIMKVKALNLRANLLRPASMQHAETTGS